MSPNPTTPVTFASPTKPAAWSWEATNAEVARRYGLPIEQVVRFDQNTASVDRHQVLRRDIGHDAQPVVTNNLRVFSKKKHCLFLGVSLRLGPVLSRSALIRRSLLSKSSNAWASD